MNANNYCQGSKKQSYNVIDVAGQEQDLKKQVDMVLVHQTDKSMGPAVNHSIPCQSDAYKDVCLAMLNSCHLSHNKICCQTDNGVTGTTSFLRGQIQGPGTAKSEKLPQAPWTFIF